MRLKMHQLLLFLLPVLAGCEEEFLPEIPDSEPQLVVEGYIEAGERPTPPYVLLTRSIPFFSDIDFEELGDLFVHGAEVRVSDGEREVQLQEICWSELPPPLQKEAARLFGFQPDSLRIDFCAYVDLSFSMSGEVGKTYHLTVQAEGQTLRAQTSLPPPVPLDSLHFVDAPGEPNDTLAQLRVFLPDPPGQANFYRYFVRVNDGPLLPGFPSVTDDRLFDGQRFELPLARPESRETDFGDLDFSTLGMFTVGDSILLKWTTLDEAHFNFWNTLEFNAANQGPFSSYTRIDSNIEGGLGIWGGYTALYYPMEVRKN